MNSLQKITLIFLVAVVSAGALSSCSQSQGPIRIPASATTGADRTTESRIFNGVNYYRDLKGQSALKRHAGLDRLAKAHCEYLVKNSNGNGLNINHNGFAGRAEMAWSKWNIPSIAENVVASSNHSGDHLVNLWIGSKSHEKNMRGNWTHTGIAKAVSPDGKIISTQLFGAAEK